MRCSVCGSKMISTTISHDCPVCGHKTPSDMGRDSSNSTGMEFECCPVCGGKLEMSFEANVSKECNNCGYTILAYTGDIPKYNQYIPDTNSLVNEPDNKPSGLYGWICPKCGRSLSPWTTECPCSVKWDLTCESTSSNGSVLNSSDKFICTVNNLKEGKLPPLKETGEGLR